MENTSMKFFYQKSNLLFCVQRIVCDKVEHFLQWKTKATKKKRKTKTINYQIGTEEKISFKAKKEMREKK